MELEAERIVSLLTEHRYLVGSLVAGKICKKLERVEVFCANRFRGYDIAYFEYTVTEPYVMKDFMINLVFFTGIQGWMFSRIYIE